MTEHDTQALIDEVARARDYLEDGKTLQADRCLAWIIHAVKTGQLVNDGPVHWFDYPPVAVASPMS